MTKHIVKSLRVKQANGTYIVRGTAQTVRLVTSKYRETGGLARDLPVPKT